MREPSREVVKKKPDAPQQRRNGLRGPVERGLKQLTPKSAERRADRRAKRASGESDSGQSDQP